MSGMSTTQGSIKVGCSLNKERACVFEMVTYLPANDINFSAVLL